MFIERYNDSCMESDFTKSSIWFTYWSIIMYFLVLHQSKFKLLWSNSIEYSFIIRFGIDNNLRHTVRCNLLIIYDLWNLLSLEWWCYVGRRWLTWCKILPTFIFYEYHQMRIEEFLDSVNIITLIIIKGDLFCWWLLSNNV